MSRPSLASVFLHTRLLLRSECVSEDGPSSSVSSDHAGASPVAAGPSAPSTPAALPEQPRLRSSSLPGSLSSAKLGSDGGGDITCKIVLPSTSGGISSSRSSSSVSSSAAVAELVCSAAAGGDAEALDRLLREHGPAAARAARADGSTPLMLASAVGRADAVRALLRTAPADDARPRDSVTALMVAIACGRLGAAVLLLAAGASPDRATTKEWTGPLGARHPAGSTVVSMARRLGRRGRPLLELLLPRPPGLDGDAAPAAAVEQRMLSGAQRLVSVAEDGRLQQQREQQQRAEVLQPPGVAAPGPGPAELCRAAARGHASEVRRLAAAGVDPNAAGEGGWPPLACAARAGAHYACMLLLKAGADPRRTFDAWLSAGGVVAGVTAAHLASRGRPAVLSLLLDAGADPCAPRSDGYTPLHVAAAGFPEVVELLLASGAPADAASACGATPLMLACSAGCAEAVQLLLDAGADPARATWAAGRAGERDPGGAAFPAGTTAADCAAAHPAVAALLRRHVAGPDQLCRAVEAGDLAAMCAALRAGVDPSAPGADGVPPLALAATGGKAYICKLLLVAGCAVDMMHAMALPGGGRAAGVTALMAAARAGCSRSAQLLLLAGADPSRAATDGATALHFAVLGGHAGTAKRLLEAGADPGARSAAGETPMDLVLRLGMPALAKLLRAGAQARQKRAREQENHRQGLGGGKGGEQASQTAAPPSKRAAAGTGAGCSDGGSSSSSSTRHGSPLASMSRRPRSAGRRLPAPALVERISGTCSVCLDAPATMAFECEHLCSCEACGLQLNAQTGTCPVCRARGMAAPLYVPPTSLARASRRLYSA
eukprot:scaffold23.g4185.t1